MDRTEKIESVRLLDILQYTSHDDVVIIKIDVEGHECKVIVQMCLCLSFFVSLCLCLCLFSFSVLSGQIAQWQNLNLLQGYTNTNTNTAVPIRVVDHGGLYPCTRIQSPRKIKTYPDLLPSVCPRSFDPFYIVSYYKNVGRNF